MPHILLLRLSAPMQSWGVMSRFSRRDTGREPSKSGIIGLMCAALGIWRDDANTENALFASLVRLKMAVLVLREGVLQSDYHTAQNIAKADGGTKDTELSNRFYLADADFVVGLESETPETLETIQAALRKPKWQLFLGRKAFVPDFPVYFRENVLETENLLEDFFQSEQFSNILKAFDDDFQKQSVNEETISLRFIIENDEQNNETVQETRHDVPLSFAKRHFTNRRVQTKFITLKKGATDDGNLSDQNNS